MKNMDLLFNYYSVKPFVFYNEKGEVSIIIKVSEPIVSL